MLRADTVPGELVPTCLGAAVLPAIMCVLVLVALSCCRLHAFGEIWICLVFVFFVIHSLSVLHVVTLSSPVPLFGFVSYYLLMILRSSTDHGSRKALCRFVLQVCLGIGRRHLITRSDVVSVAPTRVNSKSPTRVPQLHKSCCVFSLLPQGVTQKPPQGFPNSTRVPEFSVDPQGLTQNPPQGFPNSTRVVVVSVTPQELTLILLEVMFCYK